MQLQVKISENGRNNVFTSKETTKNGPSIIFRGFKVKTKVRFIFSRPKSNTKG